MPPIGQGREASRGLKGAAGATAATSPATFAEARTAAGEAFVKEAVEHAVMSVALERGFVTLPPKPVVTVPVPPPAKFAPGWPRWGTVKGPAAAWHLWASAEVAEAECGESDGTDEPIEFVHDPPPGAADLVCASCIVLDLPAAKRWADELLADPELPEQEPASAEQPKEEPAPKAKRAPKLCMIPGCGQPGARVRNEHGATEDGGLWCGEHGKLLKPEERRSCHARWKRLAADNRKAERLNARANPRAVRRG